MLNTINTLELENEMNSLNLINLGEGVYRITGENKRSTVIEVLAFDLALKTITIRQNHSVYDLEFKNNLDRVLDKMGIKRSVDTISTDIKAPMPGKVIELLVSEGDSIQKGDGIVILEAMKMENVLKAEHDCNIKKILISKGINVEKNQVLVDLA